MQPAVMCRGAACRAGMMFNLNDPDDVEMLRAARVLLWYAAGRHPRRGDVVLINHLSLS